MNKYLDCHSHILYGIDDGAKTIEDSIEILKNLSNIGFEEIILTPHYKNAYHANNKIKQEKYEILKKKIKEENINLKLYLANEVRITSNILELIEKNEIKLLGNYLFLELPFNTKIHNLERLIFELQTEDINIILVHPERYSYLTEKDLKQLIDLDIMFQINYESIIGFYGLKSKRRVKYLLKNRMVNFIGTDIHRSEQLNEKIFNKIKKKITKIIGEESFTDISYNNIKKIINESQEQV